MSSYRKRKEAGRELGRFQKALETSLYRVFASETEAVAMAPPTGDEPGSVAMTAVPRQTPFSEAENNLAGIIDSLPAKILGALNLSVKNSNIESPNRSIVAKAMSFVSVRTLAIGIFAAKLFLTVSVLRFIVELLPGLVSELLSDTFTDEKLENVYPALATGGVIAVLARAEKSVQAIIDYFRTWKITVWETLSYSVSLISAATVIILTGLAINETAGRKLGSNIEFVMASSTASLIPSDTSLFSFHTFFTDAKFMPQLAGWHTLLDSKHGSTSIQAPTYNDMYKQVARMLNGCSGDGTKVVVEIRGFASPSLWMNRETGETIDRAFLLDRLQPNYKILELGSDGTHGDFRAIKDIHGEKTQGALARAKSRIDEISNILTANRATNFADGFNLWVAENRAKSAYCKLATFLEENADCNATSNEFSGVTLINKTIDPEYTTSKMYTDTTGYSFAQQRGSPDLLVFSRSVVVDVVEAGRCHLPAS